MLENVQFFSLKKTHTHKTELYVMFRRKKPQIKRVWIVIYNIMMALYL